MRATCIPFARTSILLRREPHDLSCRSLLNFSHCQPLLLFILPLLLSLADVITPLSIAFASSTRISSSIPRCALRGPKKAESAASEAFLKQESVAQSRPQGDPWRPIRMMFASFHHIISRLVQLVIKSWGEPPFLTIFVLPQARHVSVFVS